MKKQLFLSTVYFVIVFSADYIFNLIYMAVFPNWYIPHTLIRIFRLAGIITICLTYGDYRENKAIHALNTKEDAK